MWRYITSLALLLLCTKCQAISLPNRPNPISLVSDDPVDINYGEQFFNPALGTNQTIRVIFPPTNFTDQQLPVVYFLHPHQNNVSRQEMVQYLNQTAKFFTNLQTCLSTTYTCFYHLDSACAVDCLSYIPEVGGTTNAMYLLERMGVSFSSPLPYLDPVMIVLADFRSSLYTDRFAGTEGYYPRQDFGDRSKRLLEGATGDYEAAMLHVVNYVDSNYPNAGFNRVVYGQEMGGFGAVKLALKNPSVFIGAASQSGYLNPTLLGAMFSQYRETLNEQYPSIFDVFGYGTFAANTAKPKGDGEYVLPTDVNQALNMSYVGSNDPVVLAMQLGSPVPIYLEVGNQEISNPAVFNGTKNFCNVLSKMNSPGESSVFAGTGSASSWVINIGYILSWLNNVMSNNNVDPIKCDAFS